MTSSNSTPEQNNSQQPQEIEQYKEPSFRSFIIWGVLFFIALCILTAFPSTVGIAIFIVSLIIFLLMHINKIAWLAIGAIVILALVMLLVQ